jgi:DNA-binding SARP family transcriptional activator/pimeloyl-ACP methyl ester carboxylesterase
VEFGLLGPLRVVEGGCDVTPARPKQRALLAMLLLRRGEVVPGAQLIEALWGEEPPETAQTALHGHVSALRKLIGSDRIKTRPPGYLLEVLAEEVDLARFESLVAQARELEDPDERSACLRDALALWRGEPLVELRGEAFAERESARLEDLRLAALEDRIDADLALGRHHELVPELEALVGEHCFRERPRGQLMLALYRCGRQADALSVFQSGRRALVEEIGIDPGPALRQLELQILRQDPSLDLPAAQLVPAVRFPPRRQPLVRYAPSGDLNIAYQVTSDSVEQQVRFCTAGDGVQLAYAVHGSGPPIVRAATWLTHLDFDWASPVWRHWLAELGDGHTLVRYDERGCGLSDREPGELSLDTWVADLETVVAAAGLDRFTLLGVSQGAAIALDYAARHPERLTQLVLYGAYARGRRWRGPEERRHGEAMVSAIRAGWAEANPAFRHLFSMLFLPHGSAEQMAWYDELQRRSTSAETAARLYEVRNDIDVVQFASRVTAPTLVMHARGDAVVPVEEGRLLAARIPGARLVLLESANHILLSDEPAWHAFLSELHAFLGRSTSC